MVYIKFKTVVIIPNDKNLFNLYIFAQNFIFNTSSDLL